MKPTLKLTSTITHNLFRTLLFFWLKTINHLNTVKTFMSGISNVFHHQAFIFYRHPIFKGQTPLKIQIQTKAPLIECSSLNIQEVFNEVVEPFTSFGAPLLKFEGSHWPQWWNHQILKTKSNSKSKIISKSKGSKSNPKYQQNLNWSNLI